MKDPRVRLILGLVLVILNIATLATGIFLIYHCLPLIGSGGMSFESSFLGKIEGANAYLVGLSIGGAMMIVSIMYTHKAYTECTESETRTLANIIRHHCPETDVG